MNSKTFAARLLGTLYVVCGGLQTFEVVHVDTQGLIMMGLGLNIIFGWSKFRGV